MWRRTQKDKEGTEASALFINHSTTSPKKNVMPSKYIRRSSNGIWNFVVRTTRKSSDQPMKNVEAITMMRPSVAAFGCQL
jgi:hypothetical protein